jgi:glucosyl-3-phosphoglycerate synthase
MVTVIIPALNEQSTIRKVIQVVKKSACVNEIIVIDDQSTDNTVTEARKEGVKVFSSAQRGKGISMQEGINLAGNNIISFVDADIVTYPDDVIDRLAMPIHNNEADFVKSYFERQAGRVTELVAKPLLSFLFPAISHFKQPLSGMIAGRKELFEKIMMDDDYGVDVGILIDMHKMGIRMAEVSLGFIENRMQDIGQLAKMSREVTGAILRRSGRLIGQTFETITGISTGTTSQMEYALRLQDKNYCKIAFFDMDKTLLRQSFIYTMADKFNFREQLQTAAATADPFLRIKKIALLMKDISLQKVITVANEMELVKDAAVVINEMKNKGWLCVIVSESYDVVAAHICHKLKMDFSLANELEFQNNVCTGEVKIPSFFIQNRNSVCHHTYCKTHAMALVAKKYGVHFKNIMSVGNGNNDICMVHYAGTGVAFCADNETLKKISNHNIITPELNSLLQLV